MLTYGKKKTYRQVSKWDQIMNGFKDENQLNSAFVSNKSPTETKRNKQVSLVKEPVNVELQEILSIKKVAGNRLQRFKAGSEKSNLPTLVVKDDAEQEMNPLDKKSENDTSDLELEITENFFKISDRRIKRKLKEDVFEFTDIKPTRPKRKVQKSSPPAVVNQKLSKKPLSPKKPLEPISLPDPETFQNPIDENIVKDNLAFEAVEDFAIGDDMNMDLGSLSPIDPLQESPDISRIDFQVIAEEKVEKVEEVVEKPIRVDPFEMINTNPSPSKKKRVKRLGLPFMIETQKESPTAASRESERHSSPVTPAMSSPINAQTHWNIMKKDIIMPVRKTNTVTYGRGVSQLANTAPIHSQDIEPEEEEEIDPVDEGLESSDDEEVT
jgi:hypothetical protein